MKKSYISLILVSLLSLPLAAQEDLSTFLVLSYNVENLFDTEDDPETEDEAFTPKGEKEWTRSRYQDKLESLERVIASVGGDDFPALVGLVEVENRRVLEDLIDRRGLRKANYRIVHEDSPDPRGIDCALLYRPDQFQYLDHEAIPVKDPVDPEYRHRFILHVTGTGPDGKTLHVFVNHWKSRSGGQEETRQKRMFCAITLRTALDGLFSRESDPRVILMGDFNDEPTNSSVMNGLSAGNKRKNIRMGEQYNLFYDLHNAENQGTYNFQGTWNMLDQIIVSYNLLDPGQGLHTVWDGGRIFRADWMLYENESSGLKLPSSTYGGPRYFGGPSDHLPVYATFLY
ncbi:MAG: endonuclease [Bacteroidales bacterium]